MFDIKPTVDLSIPTANIVETCWEVGHYVLFYKSLNDGLSGDIWVAEKRDGAYYPHDTYTFFLTGQESGIHIQKEDIKTYLERLEEW